MLEVAVSAELADVIASAHAAGLHYVSDDRPGIRRLRRGKGFVYVAPDGRRITDEEVLRRIRSLAIPPAYRDVWICTDPRGHIQATARDAKGRKQYRYHPRWREVRDAVKYDRMHAFAEVLPSIRARCSDDLGKPGMPREKVLATVVCLLERTSARVGNEEYRRKNHSFGLTTLLCRHARVDGAEVRFSFRGKSGKMHSVSVRDRRLARVVQRCLDIPGQELFQYVDDEGKTHCIGSGDVNDYLREITGGDFTAKDFRTWAGTVRAASELRRCPPCTNKSKAKKIIARAIETVAGALGNTPSVCRKSYVHPAVLDAYTSGLIAKVVCEDAKTDAPFALSADERFAVALLDAASRVVEPTLEASLAASLRRTKKARAPRRELRRAA